MKWCVVADVIKHATDKGMAVLGCSMHLSGCKSGRASPALVLLTAQAGLNLAVWSEQADLYWSSCDDQVQGSQRVPPYICCPMICIIPFHFCWLSFSLPLCLPSPSSLFQNEQPTPSYFPPRHWSQLFYINTQNWCFWYWYSVIPALFGSADTVTWALLALQCPSTGRQYFPSTNCEVWSSLTQLLLNCMWNLAIPHNATCNSCQLLALLSCLVISHVISSSFPCPVQLPRPGRSHLPAALIPSILSSLNFGQWVLYINKQRGFSSLYLQSFPGDQQFYS